MKKIFTGLFLFIALSAGAQITQSVSGNVLSESGQPLRHANVQLVGDSTYLTTTDSLGNFSLKRVITGRYELLISFVGYGTSGQELLVVAGKSSIAQITLSFSAVELNEVKITASQNRDLHPGNYPLTIEKTMRVPANFFDPVRLATSLPGVVATNDQSNSISIKGYSPNAMLWRLQGLDIVNPNHLANAGTLSDKPVANGGGVSIISSQVLDRTNFYSGNLPVRYGNALSGAMDMTLRPGDTQKTQYTVQASLLGLDLSTEGPLSKKKNSSYLVNYRYSTVGLLSSLGINFGDEKINFQDLTFHLNFKRRRQQISVFGFGGLSSNHFKAKPDSLWTQEKDRYTITYTGNTFGAGATDQVVLGDKTSLLAGVAFSGQQQDRASQSQTITLPAYIYSEAYVQNKYLLSSFAKITHLSSEKLLWEGGIYATASRQKLDVTTVTPLYLSDLYDNLHGTVNGVTYQPYLSSTFRTRILTLDAGLRYVFFSYNKSSSLEPRITLRSRIAKGELAASYGIVSQQQQAQTYLQFGNDKLGLTRAHDFFLQYKKSLGEDFVLTLTGYYHQLFHVPVSQLSVPYSTINQVEDIAPTNLQGTGFGRNMGIEGMLEKKFSHHYYFRLSGSTYRSEYAGSQRTYYASRFDGSFTSSFTGGKEWTTNNKTFGVHARVIYFGGLREMEIDTRASAGLGTTIYLQNGYTQKLEDYSRLDLRLSWRKNKPGYTRTIAIDIQNATNHQNVAGHYYDTFLGRVNTSYQLGIIPVLVYRVDF